MNLPRVSFITPTLNAEAVLPACLDAIRAQDYPQDLIEIVIADGGSSDSTRQIAKNRQAIVLDNPERVAESGKRIALEKITGEFVVFVDADNVIANADFTRRAVEALRQYPKALGVESYYLAATEMNSFCIYLTQTLHISDPVSWMMSVTPILTGSDGEVERWTFPPESLAYPLGANGFVYRKSDLDALKAIEDFEDTDIALRLALSGRKEWLRLKNRGVRHYVVKGMFDFVKKRRRQTYHFLSRRRKNSPSWTEMRPRVPAIVACLYCATVVGPLFHTFLGLARTKDRHWWWHPVASFASVFGLVWGILTYFTTPRTTETEAGLQPERKLEK